MSLKRTISLPMGSLKRTISFKAFVKRATGAGEQEETGPPIGLEIGFGGGDDAEESAGAPEVAPLQPDQPPTPAQSDMASVVGSDTPGTNKMRKRRSRKQKSQPSASVDQGSALSMLVQTLMGVTEAGSSLAGASFEAVKEVGGRGLNHMTEGGALVLGTGLEASGDVMGKGMRATGSIVQGAMMAKTEEELEAEEEAARLKAEADAKAAAKAAEEKRVRDLYMGRARKAFDWCPTGVYFNTDHLPIPDHQKDIFRIVWYELDKTLGYKRAGKPKYAPDGNFCGGRIYYTDGTFFDPPLLCDPYGVVSDPPHPGTEDGVIKGDGPFAPLLEAIKGEGHAGEWKVKELQFKEAFDGGKTLKKFDAYPDEDPAEWVEEDTELYTGFVRKDEKEEFSEADPTGWFVW